MKHRVLVVEDSPDVQLVLEDLLRATGYEVTVAGDGAGALSSAMTAPFDLVILDVMLPDADGMSVCGSLRQSGFDGGILMLTARTQVDDRVAGLSSGADDYLIKPFDSKELLARLEALLRRLNKIDLTPVSRFQFGDVTVDFDQRLVTRAGEVVNLAAKELLLLRHLINRRGQTISREDLLAHCWADQKFIGPRTVDVHVAWLRQKLEPDPQAPRFILTERGAGYRFAR